LWAGGGTVFGPRPRHYTFKVNRKERRAALRSALSLHAERGSLAVFDAAEFVEPAAKQAAELLVEWGAERPVAVLLGLEELVAWKSFRNLTGVDVMPVQAAGVADVVGAASLLVSEVAMPTLVERASVPVRRRSSEEAA
jgi:large subunit ribosomal protein L4